MTYDAMTDREHLIAILAARDALNAAVAEADLAGLAVGLEAHGPEYLDVSDADGHRRMAVRPPRVAVVSVAREVE